MARLSKAEIKQAIRNGRLKHVPNDATLDLEKIQQETGKDPAFHTFKGKMYQEVAPVAAHQFDPESELNREFGDRSGSCAWASTLHDIHAPFAKTDAMPAGLKHSVPIDLPNEMSPEGETARKIMKIMEGLPLDQQRNILHGLRDGVFKVEVDGMEKNDGEKVASVIGRLTRGLEPDDVTAMLSASCDGTLTAKQMGGMCHMKPDVRMRYLNAVKAGDRKARVKILKETKKRIREPLWAKDKDLKNLEERRDFFKRRIAAVEEMRAVAEAPRLQKLGESCYHKFLTAWRDGDIVLPEDYQDTPEEFWNVHGEDIQIFVVQHDWARAFEKAEGIEEHEVILPYDECVFEFRISGKRWLFQISGDEETNHMVSAMLVAETSVGWALANLWAVDNGVFTSRKPRGQQDCESVMQLCRAQVRHVLIALEAEVAVTEVVRAPHKLNAKRERAGKLPIFDHRIVHLAERKRYAPRDPQDGDLETEHRRRRLHFVRSHWRHYANHKVPIKWHLRGDPDLGFIDKEYRL